MQSQWFFSIWNNYKTYLHSAYTLLIIMHVFEFGRVVIVIFHDKLIVAAVVVIIIFLINCSHIS